jgi:general secretion pathway protein D
MKLRTQGRRRRVAVLATLAVLAVCCPGRADSADRADSAGRADSADRARGRVAPPATPPPPLPPPAGEELAFNTCLKLGASHPVHVSLKPETDMGDVVAWISSITCRGFITPAGLTLGARKVTVSSPASITAAEAYALFLALLDSVGLALEPAGRFQRIIEAGKAARAETPLYPPGVAPARDDGHVTQLVRLAHADAQEMATLLQGYRGEAGTVVVHAPTRTLIITDRATTVRRLLALVAELDVAGEALKLWSLPARHLPAAELAALLGELAALPASVRAGDKGPARPAPAGPAAGPAPAADAGVARLLPDERAGRLLVVATEAAFARLAALAQRLDVPADARGSQVHVYRCRHADCDAVAAILATLTGIQVARGPSPEAARRPAATPGGGPAAAPRAPGAASSSSSSASPAAGAAAALFAGELRITSDPSTNALLVLGGLSDFRTLRRLIDEIDVPRKQVFIEATILEVVRRKDRNTGVAWHLGRADGRGAVVGGFDAGRTLLLDEQSLGSTLVGLSGLAVGAPVEAVARMLGLPAGQVPSLGALLQLVAQDENVDLIANPHIMITNNHEGQLSVGQRVPVQTGFTSLPGATAGSSVPISSVSREDVALTLTLIPHVNDDNVIRLEIDQEMSELASAGAVPLNPTTTRRTAHTTVYAHDQQTIIIGGLTRDRVSEATQKIPLLGDIPVLGFLFRSRQKSVEKQNIILALTPYVIDGPADLSRVLEAKLRDRRDYLKYFGKEAEQRLLDGPLPRRRSPGMLERINQAARAAADDDDDAAPPAGAGAAAASAVEPAPGGDAGLPLPGS